ncbi:MAG: DUF1643 domain-containing protein [Haliscomenobacter sp.]|nr:DUF1643 domain-containing protein [Haliscomenobacter sp.]
MVNVEYFAQRATNPKNLHTNFDIHYHHENLRQIENYLQKVNSAKIWCAWGETILIRSYLSLLLKDIVTILGRFNYDFVSFGEETKTGHPRHPSRLPL